MSPAELLVGPAAIETAPCGACGQPGPAEPLFRCRERVFRRDDAVFTVGRCGRCGHVFLSERPPEAGIGRYYPDGYDAHRKADAPSPRKKSRRHRFITRKPPFRVLDVGCGSGYDLLRFREEGCEVYGVETDPGAAARAREKGIRVHAGAVESADFGDARFDVVTMNFSLEHLYDPRAALANVRRMLAPDGMVYLLFPTADSWAFRRFGPDWHHLDPPRHLQFFTRASFSRLCEETGFRIAHYGGQSGTRGLRRSLALRGERSPLSRALHALSRWSVTHWFLRVLMRFVVDPLGGGDVAEVVLRRSDGS